MEKNTTRGLSLRIERRLLLAAVLVFSAWSAVFIYKTSILAIDGRRYFCLFDDAMISMRYAWNLSHGTGLVWNAGETVQGYTNLLMTLLMALAALVQDKSLAVLLVQILGVGFMLVIAWTTLRIADRLVEEDELSRRQRTFIRVLAFILALSYYPLAYWSLMGMETGLLSMLLLLGILFALSYSRSGRRADIWLSAILLGLAFLTRNDSLIFSLLIGAYVVWKTTGRKSTRKAFLQLAPALALYLLFILGQSLLQYWYYGEVLPNTYILKLTGWTLSDRLPGGLGFVLPFLVQTGILLLPAAFSTWHPFRRERLLLLSIVLSSIAYQVYVGGDPWYHWRMMAPTVPLLMILFLIAVSGGLQDWAGRKASKPKLLPGMNSQSQTVAIALLGVLVANAFFLPEILFLESPFYVSANRHNINTAVALTELTGQGASLGVLWAGAIPYYAERRGIDFLGKSDRYIASLPVDSPGTFSLQELKSPPGHNKYDLRYSIQQLQPTYIQDDAWRTQDLSQWVATRYVQVEYKGMTLLLLRNSPDVLWEKVNIPE